MSRSLAFLVLCCAAPAHAAWTQLDPPADPTGWAEITVSPAFADSPPLIQSALFPGGPDLFLETEVFWLDFGFSRAFRMRTPRNNVTVFATIGLLPEAQAGVAEVLVERLGDFVNHGAQHDNSQSFRVTSSAGIREFTQNVSVQFVPEPSALLLVTAPAIAFAAIRRRHH